MFDRIISNAFNSNNMYIVYTGNNMTCVYIFLTHPKPSIKLVTRCFLLNSIRLPHSYIDMRQKCSVNSLTCKLHE